MKKSFDTRIFVRLLRWWLVCILFNVQWTIAWGKSQSVVVGLQVLDVAKPGSRFQLLSVPFLKPSVARGRLDGVDSQSLTLNDAQGSFASLNDLQPHLLIIRSGPEKGSWFLINSTGLTWATSGTTARATNDGIVGSLADLAGNEVFSVHPLFTIGELFPEDGSGIPAARLDIEASQLHFLRGGKFEKYWLSDGTITGEPGWYVADRGSLRRGGDDPILPGTSFFVEMRSPPAEVLNVRVVGEVLTDAIRIPLDSGFNLVAVEHNLSRKDADGLPSFRLKNLGLLESGFVAADTAEDSDQLLMFSVDSETFDEGFWLSGQLADSSWRAIGGFSFSDDAEVEAGQGFVIWTKGSSYLWLQGE